METIEKKHQNEQGGQNNRVSVIGLGTMGSAIARAFLDRGFRTTVWNRTTGRTAPLVEAGATAADSAAHAVAASPITVICVLDSGAVEQVLASLDADAAVLDGRVLVNVTSGTPAQAREIARWAGARGADHLDSKIMGDPPYVGTDQIMFPFSGSAPRSTNTGRPCRPLARSPTTVRIPAWRPWSSWGRWRRRTRC